MREILKNLNQRPIAYYPIHKQLTGSTTSGLLLSQLMYWFAKQDRFHKTDCELVEETFLTPKELKNAKVIIKKLDFIKVSLEGIPAKTYYEIDWEKYQTSLYKLNKQVGPKGTNCVVPKGETNKNNNFNTETTTERKNTKKEFDDFLDQLKAAVKIKSKVTKTKDGEKLFKSFESLEAKQKLFNDYVAHQEKEKEFSKRITAFMEDYDFYAGKKEAEEWSSYGTDHNNSGEWK